MCTPKLTALLFASFFLRTSWFWHWHGKGHLLTHMWPFSAPLSNSKVWECPRVRNAHKSPSIGKKLFPSCKTHRCYGRKIWVVDLSLIKAFKCKFPSIVYDAYIGEYLLGDKNDTILWAEDLWWQQGCTCVQIFRSTNIQTCNCQGPWFLRSHALWQTHSNSDVCIGVHVRLRWLYETSVQPWCDVSMEMYTYSVELNHI